MKTARLKPEATLLGDVGPRTIGFRLDAEHRRLLCQQADRMRVTPHEFARNVLVAALHQPERLSAIEDAILQLAAQIQDFQSHLAKATELLLVATGEIPEQDAKALVNQALKRD